MTSLGISNDVDKAADVLLRGGIVGMPTETVYGLAALALNESAVYRVFDTKGRPRNHPLIVHLAHIADVPRWGILNSTAQKLAESFWPGPLTLLLPRTDLVPDWVTGGRDTVAIRIPQHPMALRLLSIVNDGVVAPSANRFGKVSPTTAQHVLADLDGDVDIILDGGHCTVGLESTIVECTEKFQILRPGQISESQISAVAGIAPETSDGISRAPGMLSSHYAPQATVVITDSLATALQQQSKLSPSNRTRIINFEDANEYAEKLYDELRQADSDAIDVVIAVRAPNADIGAAVNDRLAKAAAER